MLLRTLMASVILLGTFKAHALSTESQPPSVLLELGTQLANSAGSSQWQQLWQRTRQTGYLNSGAQGVHFDVPQAEIPALVAATLAAADEALALKQTHVLYRRDFHPRVVGKVAAKDVTALCLWVDWRSFPEHGIHRPADYLGQVSLLLTRPCE
ncbi:hypothetical protein [Pseudomonas sp. SBB6]|uniref:hypothetical protein n=1 Tax=Pseudomonas sp. SBB6 TaxID=2962032 RepID=UPI0020B74E0B|nr:hypothetical protein [Pseudomonas sp. SBB6]MCP3752859.1 hypothetical protein [Pseudomonas sp. SBB6]